LNIQHIVPTIQRQFDKSAIAAHIER